MDLRVQLSSCVPATAFETSGATLLAADLLPLRVHPKVIGLAEFMNFPGVLNTDADVLDKLVAFQDGHIDGHAPLVRGYDLNGYLAARIRTDHETTIAADGREKLKKGMQVLIREGSITKDLHALAEILDEHTSSFCCLCTDDRNPLDIAEEGHLDYMIRTLIALGRPLHHVYRAASWSAANAFGLRDRGMIAPGRRADIVLVDDLAACSVKTVISAGRVVDDDTLRARAARSPPVGLDSVKARAVTADDFRIPGSAGELQMIGVVPGRSITERVVKRVPAAGGERMADPANDVAKVAVVERHGKNGNIGRGFVTGFGLQRGAIASSVGHDSHNICVVGVERRGHGGRGQPAPRDRAAGSSWQPAVKVIAELALPLAGLMSVEPFETVRAGLLGAPPRGARARLHAAGTLPAGRVPAAAGHSAPEDHRLRPVRRRPLRAGQGMTGRRRFPAVRLPGDAAGNHPPPLRRHLNALGTGFRDDRRPQTPP